MRLIWCFLLANIGMLPDLSRPHKGRIAPVDRLSGFGLGVPPLFDRFIRREN